MRKTEQGIQNLRDEITIRELELRIASQKAQIAALDAISVGIAAEREDAERKDDDGGSDARRLCFGRISEAAAAINQISAPSRSLDDKESQVDILEVTTALEKAVNCYAIDHNEFRAVLNGLAITNDAFAGPAPEVPAQEETE